MPIFEYSCRQCGHRFEKLQKSADELAPLCPACGSTETARELSCFSATTKAPSHACSGGG
jgi:putative FmdB family regulatory protein